jgi:hypothetical protein
MRGNVNIGDVSGAMANSLHDLALKVYFALQQRVLCYLLFHRVAVSLRELILEVAV